MHRSNFLLDLMFYCGRYPLDVFAMKQNEILAAFKRRKLPMAVKYLNMWRICLAKLIGDVGVEQEEYDIDGVVTTQAIILVCVHHIHACTSHKRERAHRIHASVRITYTSVRITYTRACASHTCKRAHHIHVSVRTTDIITSIQACAWHTSLHPCKRAHDIHASVRITYTQACASHTRKRTHHIHTCIRTHAYISLTCTLYQLGWYARLGN